jgi:thiol:disulfide interchange protein/DsbC/DsbD-like thiol-disulfide interchange protein
MTMLAPFMTLLTVLLLLPGTLDAQVGLLPADQEGQGPHTTVSLVADARSIQPGATFIVGFIMTMEEGWHTYWKNAGEAGLPTEIAWDLPAGLTAGDIMWPVPHKYNEGGEVVTFGYGDETMLMVPITASGNLRPGSMVSLKARVNWLECKHVCIPGSATVTLSLPVSGGGTEPANTNLFDRYRRQLPLPAGAISDLHVEWEVRRGSVFVVASTPHVFQADDIHAPDFYPETIDDIETGRTTVRFDHQSATITLPLTSYEPVDGPRVLRGVIVYAFESSPWTGVQIEIPLSAEFCASLPRAGGEEMSGSVLDSPFESVAAQGTRLSFGMYLLFAVVGGLLLNVMPCVLPVIALKIFGLVGLGGDQPKKVRTLGFMFSLGILVSFLTLAILVIILQAAGEQVGWGFQFQEPAFVIVMSTIVFAFGLSLFGVYEINLPGFAVSGLGKVLDNSNRSGKSASASFAEGVFATVLATPCTAPFLGTALGFAFSQPAWVILLIFTGVAIGMSLPYLVLTTKPAWTKYLPKPGEWMVTAKQFMGFLMMGTLIWLLYVLGRQLGMEAVIWVGGFLLMVGMACWLIGKYATLTATRRQLAVTWVLVAVLLGGGYWLFLEDIFAARDIISENTSQTMSASEQDGIQWRAFSLEQLDTELRGDAPVFIDFTADWCLTCKVNEKSVLTDRSVIEKFRTLNITAFKADWTTRNPEITQLLAKFGRSGVPLYVIFPPGRRSSPIVLPEIITTGIVLDALDRATQVSTTASRPE